MAGSQTFAIMLEPNRGLRVERCDFSLPRPQRFTQSIPQPEENPWSSPSEHITPLVALIAGILILIMPRLLNFIVAIYLIIVGLMGLNDIHHFIH